MKKTWFRIFVAALALALIAVSCGGDDDDGSEAADTPEPEEQTTEAPVDLTAFCDAIVEAETLVIAASEGDQSADPTAALDEAESTAPEEISDQVTTLVEGARTALEEQDDSIFEDPAFRTADEEVDIFVLENCGNETFAVTATEYEFGGLPETTAAGSVGFNVINAGQELHEMALVRLNDPSQSVEEILQLPEKQAQKAITRVGFLFVEPGQQDAQTFALEAGTYGVACFIPVGTTPNKEGDGPPHALEGMYGQFTVE